MAEISIDPLWAIAAAVSAPAAAFCFATVTQLIEKRNKRRGLQSALVAEIDQIARTAWQQRQIFERWKNRVRHNPSFKTAAYVQKHRTPVYDRVLENWPDVAGDAIIDVSVFYTKNDSLYNIVSDFFSRDWTSIDEEERGRLFTVLENTSLKHRDDAVKAIKRLGVGTSLKLEFGLQ